MGSWRLYVRAPSDNMNKCPALIYSMDITYRMYLWGPASPDQAIRIARFGDDGPGRFTSTHVWSAWSDKGYPSILQRLLRTTAMWQDPNARASIMWLISGGTFHSTAGCPSLEPPKPGHDGSSEITAFLMPYM